MMRASISSAHNRLERYSVGWTKPSSLWNSDMTEGTITLLWLRTLTHHPLDQGGGVDAETMKSDPFSGAVYVFRAKRADRVKLIYWLSNAHISERVVRRSGKR